MIIQQTGLNVEHFPAITVRGTEIERVYCYKYLGLVVDHRLRWDQHVKFVRSKVTPFVAVLRKCAQLVPETSKLSLYYSAIHCHFLYLISIWGSTAMTRIQELERLQNKAVRFIFWRDYYYDGLSTSDLYKKYKILKINELVKYEAIMIIFRVRHGFLRTYIISVEWRDGSTDFETAIPFLCAPLKNGLPLE